MADTIPSTCPRCASPMSATDAAGLCPRCLLALNFQTRTMPTGGEAVSSPPPTPAELEEKFPQFEILECLGRGGMGIVYKARQKALDRIVAIKILAGEWQDAPGFADRFEKEAKLLAKLNHPNIVTIHDFGNAGGLFHIVMEFIDGVNVRDLLRDGKMPAEQALAIVPPICDALQFAHDHGIVHRDIKPENILLDREGRVKIADFGIATLAGDAADRSGTPAYMAPEQEVHAARIDHRADIYALGVVLYEMLTGERPAASPVAPSKRVRIDVRLDEVVLRALENTPELRFQSAVEFHTVLEQAVEAAVLNGPARASGPPRAGLPESPRAAVVAAARWSLPRAL
jgi:serine/threonine protein kinase